MRIPNKVVLITGAGRGIGRETAILLASEGARVVVTDRDAEPVAEVLATITAAGGTALGLTCDVTKRDEVDAVVAKTIEAFGGIDVLINNAGITADARFVNMTEAEFDRVIHVNLKGVFVATQAVLATMLAAGKGKIISASSVVGIHGNFGQTNYAATKAGVIGMTKTWARELAPKGITANAVAPGFILTDMTRAVPEKVLETMRSKTPVGRIGDPADIAKAYLFLASDDSDYINGHVLSVDGGLGL